MRMRSYAKSSSGFTLIELIVVIVILGVLSVTAAPKFLNFSKDARISTLKGLQGAVKSSMELSVAASNVKGTSNFGPTLKSMVLDGNFVILTPLGYPASWTNGLIHLVDIDDDSWVILPLSQSVKILPLGKVEGDDCYFKYDASVITAKPVLSIETTEC